MSLKLFSSCSVAALALLGAAAANATGVASGASTLPVIAGYVEAHAGWESGWSTHYDPSADGTGSWSDHMFGGSGRAAIALAPNWTVQGDAWSDVAVAPDGSDGVDSGISGHVTWRSADGVAMLGVLASLGIGGSDAGTVDNFGVEGVLNANRWRLYGQAGVTRGVSGDASNLGERDIYATLSVDYFLNPNLFVSGNIGTDRWTQSNGDSSPETSWGAKLEFKPGVSPVSFFVAYEGYGFRSNYSGVSYYDQGVDNVFFVGGRVPLGVATLEDMQHAVGLADLNPSFGDMMNR